MAFKAILFDCDGVLVQSEKIGSTLEIDMLEALGCDVDHQVLHQTLYGRTQQEAFDYFRQQWGSKIPPNFEQEFFQNLDQRFKEQLRPMPGVENVVAFLELPKAVVTNSTQERLTFVLSKTGLIDYFVGKMFTLDQVTQGKPAPDLYLLAAETLGVAAKECLVVEDSIVGVQSAVAAGMTVLGFIGGDHTFDGHDASLRAAGATDVITEFPKLLDYLRDHAA